MAEKLSLVDMIGIGNLLEPLVAEDIITCEERDRIILQIAKDNEIDEYRLSVLAGYKRSKAEVLARMEQRKQSKPQHKKQDDSYISLTELARNHSKNTPGYVIQSWLRSENTLAFLNLWEQENNPDYREAGYIELLEKKKTASFTLTPKLKVAHPRNQICSRITGGLFVMRQSKRGSKSAWRIALTTLNIPEQLQHMP